MNKNNALPCHRYERILRRWLAGVGIVAFCGLIQACNSGASTQQQQPDPPAGDTAAPSVPADVVAAAASNSRVDVSWSASTDTGGSGLSGYRLYRDGAGTALATVNAPATTYADTGLAASTQYSYVVRAFDVAGNESASSSAAAAATQANPVSGVSGLDSRPSNTTCLAWDRPNPSGTISLEPFTSLTFNSAVALLQAPGDNSHWYVVEQGGAVKRFTMPNPAASTTVINVPVTFSGEAGLLGMTFHPNFPTDKRVFLSYTTTVAGQLISRISSFITNDNGATLSGENVLLTLNQPEPNHNGGNIAFGPDGYLYIGFGDGGGGGDAHGDPGNGQRLTTMLGKMLRIDVSPATGYNIPPTNPFATNAKCGPDTRASGECPEIYAWGFRNPWRWSFDRSTSELWVGDVGQGQWEEVDQVARGGNYGWRCREGAHDFASGSTTGCSGAALIDPVAEYDHDHDRGIAITGGFVYRGTQNTPLRGRFIFGDYGSGDLWAWVPENATQPRRPTLLLQGTGLLITSFGQGNDGEIYAVNTSSLHHIVFAPATGGGTAPATLSATGCVNPTDPTKPAAGLIPYAVNAPFWSDGAAKERWIGLPDGANITVKPDTDWDFPNRTVLVKNFRVGNRLIETRLFMRHPDGNWGGFSYEWNAQQTDATLLKGGAVRDIGGGQQWIFPSESQCLECHTAVAGRSLGLETRQLNRDLLYAQSGVTANELFTLNHINAFTPTIPDPAAQPAMPDPVDTTASLDKRARAYLHTNCAQCHRAGGPTPSNMDLRYTDALTIAETKTCNVAPQSGDLGLGANARLIVPGNATNSILVNRMNRRDANGMPRLASNQVDATGVALITQWINGMTGC
jgi:uncharacterized repeat protein (TIGR03806 family)